MKYLGSLLLSLVVCMGMLSIEANSCKSGCESKPARPQQSSQGQQARKQVREVRQTMDKWMEESPEELAGLIEITRACCVQDTLNAILACCLATSGATASTFTSLAALEACCESELALLGTLTVCCGLEVAALGQPTDASFPCESFPSAVAINAATLNTIEWLKTIYREIRRERFEVTGVLDCPSLVPGNPY